MSYKDVLIRLIVSAIKADISFNKFKNTYWTWIKAAGVTEKELMSIWNTAWFPCEYCGTINN